MVTIREERTDRQMRYRLRDREHECECVSISVPAQWNKGKMGRNNEQGRGQDGKNRITDVFMFIELYRSQIVFPYS